MRIHQGVKVCYIEITRVLEKHKTTSQELFIHVPLKNNTHKKFKWSCIYYKTWIVRHLSHVFSLHKRSALAAGGNDPNSKENSEIIFPQPCFDVNLLKYCCDIWIGVHDNTLYIKLVKTRYFLRMVRCELETSLNSMIYPKIYHRRDCLVNT